MARGQMRNISWPIDVTTRMVGVSFPVDRRTAEERLDGVNVKGRNVTEYFDNMRFPLNSPADLTEQIKNASEGKKVTSSE